jgi:anti-anti-sigma factor
MSVIGTDQPERSADLRSFDCHTARFTTQWPDENVGIITVQGELDASNATQFADHVEQCADDGVRLILDLSSLEFFGTAGFSALHTINVRCAHTGSRWALVTGDAVARLLRPGQRAAGRRLGARSGHAARRRTPPATAAGRGAELAT